jgi:hypothetical protein
MPSDCNKKFKASPNEMYCGKHACSAAGGELRDSCDADDLKGCPSGYRSVDYIRSSIRDGEDSYCSWGTQFDDGKLHKCSKDENNDIWNPMYQLLLTDGQLDKDKDNFNSHLKKAFNCCNNNVLTESDKQACGDLYTKNEEGGEDCSNDRCKVVMKQFCVDNGDKDRMKDSKCINYCKNNPEVCESRLKEFCADKVDKKEFEKTCACYYPSEVYENMWEAFSNEWNIPEQLVDTTKECFFPLCTNADIKRNVTCKDVNITNCLQTVNIDAEGSVIGELKLKQSTACASKFRRKNNREKLDKIHEKISKVDSDITNLEQRHSNSTTDSEKADLQTQIDAKKTEKQTLETQKVELSPASSSPSQTSADDDAGDDAGDDADDDSDDDSDDNTMWYLGIAALVLCVIFLVFGVGGIMLMM